MGRRAATRPALPPLPSATPSVSDAMAAPTGASAMATPTRRQPLLLKNPVKSRGARCAEVAGGTAADCAAICCCCPCGLVNLLVMAVVKLPAGLCRKALKKKRCKKSATRKGLLGAKMEAVAEDDESLMMRVQRQNGTVFVAGSPASWPERSPSEEETEMEKEMWARFYGTGFWRSPSQREGSTVQRT